MMTRAAALPAREIARRDTGKLPWLDPMVTPSLGVLAFVFGYPIVYTLVLSVQYYNLLSAEQARFVGAGNYGRLLSDPIFWKALGNTAIYTFGSVAVSVLLGLALALLTENFGGRRGRLARALLLTPWAVPFVVVAFLFRYMYLQNGGAINALLLSAALAGIPNEVIESARVDRARTLSMIFRIKLPFLRNALLISSLLMIIANFNAFAKIWAMTQGGPGYSTTTLVIYVYRQAFENFAFGYASAIGVVWLLLLLAFAIAYLRALRMD